MSSFQWGRVGGHPDPVTRSRTTIGRPGRLAVRGNFRPFRAPRCSIGLRLFMGCPVRPATPRPAPARPGRYHSGRSSMSWRRFATSCSASQSDSQPNLAKALEKRRVRPAHDLVGVSRRQLLEERLVVGVDGFPRWRAAAHEVDGGDAPHRLRLITTLPAGHRVDPPIRGGRVPGASAWSIPSSRTNLANANLESRSNVAAGCTFGVPYRSSTNGPTSNTTDRA